MDPNDLKTLRNNAHELAEAYEGKNGDSDTKQIESLEEALREVSSAQWRLMRAVYEKEEGNSEDKAKNINARRIARYFADRLESEAQQRAAKRQLIVSIIGWTLAILGLFLGVAQLKWWS